MAGHRWLPFIRSALASDDVKLSSHAGRALLNLMSARAARCSSHHGRIEVEEGGDSDAGGCPSATGGVTGLSLQSLLFSVP